MNIEAKPQHRLGQENITIVEYKNPQQMGFYPAYQLVEKSKQDHIMEFEFEDSEPGGRFSSIESIRKWMESERVTNLLVDDDNGQVAGIDWFRPGRLPREGTDRNLAGYNITFGIRLFEGYTGRGLALPFMAETHRSLVKYAQGRGLWLSAKKDNQKAVGLYRKFGYRYDYESADLIYMVNDDALVV